MINLLFFRRQSNPQEKVCLGCFCNADWPHAAWQPARERDRAWKQSLYCGNSVDNIKVWYPAREKLSLCCSLLWRPAREEERGHNCVADWATRQQTTGLSVYFTDCTQCTVHTLQERLWCLLGLYMHCTSVLYTLFRTGCGACLVDDDGIRRRSRHHWAPRSCGAAWGPTDSGPPWSCSDAWCSDLSEEKVMNKLARCRVY